MNGSTQSTKSMTRPSWSMYINRQEPTMSHNRHMSPCHKTQTLKSRPLRLIIIPTINRARHIGFEYEQTLSAYRLGLQQSADRHTRYHEIS